LVAGGVVGRAAGKVVGAKVGEKTGEVAAREILAENTTTAVGYNYPGLTGIVANQARQEAIEAGIAAGARDGLKVGIGAGAVSGKAIADNRNHGAGSPSVLDGAWKQGEQAAGDLFSGSPSGSNWGSLLGGGQPPTQIQSQSTEGSDSVKKDDTPPPSGR
jgi:hypothetical protein